MVGKSCVLRADLKTDLEFESNNGVSQERVPQDRGLNGDGSRRKSDAIEKECRT